MTKQDKTRQLNNSNEENNMQKGFKKQPSETKDDLRLRIAMKVDVNF